MKLEKFKNETEAAEGRTLPESESFNQYPASRMSSVTFSEALAKDAETSHDHHMPLRGNNNAQV